MGMRREKIDGVRTESLGHVLHDGLQTVGISLACLGVSGREFEGRDEATRRCEGNARHDRSFTSTALYLDHSARFSAARSAHNMYVHQLGKHSPGVESSRVVMVPRDNDRSRAGAADAFQESEH